MIKPLTRLRIILQRLNDGEQLGVKELAEDFNVSTRTIQRDFNEKLVGNYPIFQENKKWKMQDDFKIEKIRDVEEQIVLDIIEKITDNIGDKFAKRAHTLLSKIKVQDKLSGISHVTINKLFYKVRKRIAQECDDNSPIGLGEIELDESYFGAKRIRGKIGRGAGGKIPVFGMLKRNGNVYTQVIKNCSFSVLMPIIEAQATKESTIYTDGFKSYDGLVNYGYKKHFRIKHSKNEFANGHNHINGIENFWGLCKVRLGRFRGIHKHKFYYHLKECE